jgi:hypothetical protein
MKHHDGRPARRMIKVQIPLVNLRGHLRKSPLQQGVGVRQNGGVVWWRFLWWDKVDKELKRGPGHWGGSASWGGLRWGRWWHASGPCFRGCGRRCCSYRLRLPLCMGLLPGRQLRCIRVVGPLPDRPRLCVQLQVLRRHRLVQLTVAVNPGLKMVVEQDPRFPIATLPHHPKLLHLGLGVS